MRTDVTFVSNSLTPAGHLHTPDARAGHPLPAIVVIHPWGGVKEQTGGLHARRLTEHGFTALTFEAAHQGASEGEPHFPENPVRRAEDIKSAVSHLGTQQDVDPDRIGALDTPTGGGHAVVYATISDQPIGAVHTVSAACSGSLWRDRLGGGQDPAVYRDPAARAGLLCTDEAPGEPTLVEHIVPEEADETTPDHRRQGHEHCRTAHDALLRSENACVARCRPDRPVRQGRIRLPRPRQVHLVLR